MHRQLPGDNVMNLSVEAKPHYIESNNIASVYLKQGECYISSINELVQVKTVLGSCVTITMHCPILKIGGITHSLLPFPLNGAPAPPDQVGRYVNTSVKYIFERLSMMGGIKKNLQVKIFGGAQMFWADPEKPPKKALNIGRRNVETALETIDKLGLTITATNVGGRQGRKLLFFPHQGDVWVKKINRILRPPGGANG